MEFHLDELDKDSLIIVLHENISSGLSRQIEREIPLSNRSSEDVRALDDELVIEPTGCPIMDSLYIFAA